MKNKSLFQYLSISSLRRSKTVFRNFMVVSCVFLCVLAAATIAIYTNARKTIQSELIHTNESINSNIVQSVDDLIKEMQQVTAYLSMNQLVQLYFQSNNPEDFFDGYESRIKESINSYTYGFEYIDSIYIYAEKFQTYISSAGSSTHNTSPDTNWIAFLDDMDSNNGLLARKVNDLYPFVLSIIHRTQLQDCNGYVILNLNLRKLPNILESSTVSNVYLINNQNQILYREWQDDVLEPLNVSPELENYQFSEEPFSTFINGDTPYIYSQSPSDSYPWSYVTVTHLNEYTSQLSQLRNILVASFVLLLIILSIVAFALSILAYLPVYKMLSFLNNPSTWNNAEDMAEKDIQNIVNQVIAYAQANTRLSEELQERLLALKTTQVIALQTQINPHFMVNTLNLIYCEIIKELGSKHLAASMTFHLGRLLGYSLDSTFLVTLSEEFDNTECYLKILQVRYSNQIDIDITLGELTEDIQVPKLILQPLIENCIYHGVKNKLDSKLCITVRSELCTEPPIDFTANLINQKVKKENSPSQDDEKCVLITVSDNGIGIPPEKVAELTTQLHGDISLNSNHVGLKNVVSRLRLLYGENCYVDLSSTEGSGTCVKLYLYSSPDSTLMPHK